MRAVRQANNIEMIFNFDESSNIEEIRLDCPGENIPLARGEQFCRGWRVVVSPAATEAGLPGVTAEVALGHNKHRVIIGWDFNRAYIWPDRLPSRRCWADWEPGDEGLDELPEDRWLARARALAERAGLETETYPLIRGEVVAVSIEEGD